MSPRLAFAIDAAHKAGRFTQGYFQTGTSVDVKSDGSPVTAADRGAERLIRELIAEQFPNDRILGEEEGESLPGTGATSRTSTPLPPSSSGAGGGGRWVIDPIDGTKSFVCGVPLYATLISYEEDGEPVLGVCYFPSLDEMVYAEKGSGAFWNGRPCRVSETGSLTAGIVSSGSLFSMRKAGRTEGFQRIIDRARFVRNWSDAYGHTLVATGRVDGMIDPIVSPWDISAMRVIVLEAGGRFTDFKGGEDPQSEAIASNGFLHEEILEAFRP